MKEKSFLPLEGIEPRLLRFPAHRLVAVLINLKRFHVVEARKKKIKQFETNRGKEEGRSDRKVGTMREAENGEEEILNVNSAGSLCHYCVKYPTMCGSGQVAGSYFLKYY